MASSSQNPPVLPAPQGPTSSREAATDTHKAMTSSDEAWMRAALAEAAIAAEAGDVPVGAVVVSSSGMLLSRGHNRRELDRDPTAHAELNALRDASRTLGAWRLCGTTVYSTLEPCPMCAGALVNARIARLVYGCADPKAGAIDTLFQLGRDARLNHRFSICAGVLADDCAEQLRAFFARLRSGAMASG